MSMGIIRRAARDRLADGPAESVAPCVRRPICRARIVSAVRHFARCNFPCAPVKKPLLPELFPEPYRAGGEDRWASSGGPVQQGHHGKESL